MNAAVAHQADVERVLGLKTVREPTSRGHFLAAIREFGKDGAEFTLERLQHLMRIEEHFQALLLYDQIDFLRALTHETGPVRAVGTVLNETRTTALAEGRIEDATGKLYAFATTTCAIRRAGLA